MKSLFLAMCAWCCRASLLRIRGENGALHFGPESDVKFLRTAHGNLTLEGNLVFADSNSASTSSLLEMLWEIRDLRSSVVELASHTNGCDEHTSGCDDPGSVCCWRYFEHTSGCDDPGSVCCWRYFEHTSGCDYPRSVCWWRYFEHTSGCDEPGSAVDQVAASSEVVVEYIHALRRVLTQPLSLSFAF